MSLLLCTGELHPKVVRQHLQMWFAAPGRLGGRAGLLLGRSSSLPLGVKLGLKAHREFFFHQRSDFALVISHRHWPAIQSFLSTKDPDFASQVQAALDPKPTSFLLPGLDLKNRPQVMGILNLTPDSFYDGGQYQGLENALAQAERMIKAGADWLDLGGESTRPGSDPVGVEQELGRVLPVLREIKQRWSLPLSVDTHKPEVALAALSAGASLINDVSGLSAGPRMLALIKQFEAGYVLMHTQGRPKTMQENPKYDHPILDIAEFFEQKLVLFQQAGVSKQRILLDPGIGFGKLLVHNLELLRMHSAWGNLGCQTLLGTSNKSFITQALGLPLAERQSASLATQVLGSGQGAQFFRVHHVQETRQALDMVEACNHIPGA